MARSHSRVWVYVGREFLLFFSVSFLFFFFLFFLNQVLVMAEEIFAKKVPFWDVLRLVLYSLPVVFAYAFPFGALVGALMAIGRLASDNEVLSLAALGVPPRQMLVPLLVLGLAFSLVSFVMNDYFIPLGNIRFAEIYRRIVYSNPALELEPLSVKRYENTTIITGGVEGRKLENLLIIDRSPEGNRRVITAREAQLEDDAANQGVIALTLQSVFSQLSYPREGDRYDYTLSDSMIYRILLKNITSATIGGLTPSSMSSVDVWNQIRSKSESQRGAAAQKEEKVRALAFSLASGMRAAERLGADVPGLVGQQRAVADALLQQLSAEKARNVTDQSLQAYRVEWNRKFSMPAACLVFALFAFPVGMRARRSGRTVGFGIGLLVAIVYWGLLLAGQTFGVRMSLSPALSMWLPDALVLSAGIALLAFGGRR
jgi:lipopolysaccharide export system permease protein